MARPSLATSTDTSETAEAPARRRRASGPRKQRPVRVVYSIVDGDGNPIQGASAVFHVVTKDTDLYVAAIEQNPLASKGTLKFSGPSEEAE